MKLMLCWALVTLISVYHDFIHWWETHLLSCPFKKVFLIDCPGCGLQRSFIALLRGDVMTSFHLYPATIPMLVLLMFAVLHIKFQFKYGATVIKFLYIFIALVIIVNYLIKIQTKTLL